MDLLIIAILAAILGGAGYYVWRAKKSGRKCIGCPSGGGSFKRDILAGLKDGRLDRDDLRRCCANVVASIFDSQTQREYIG